MRVVIAGAMAWANETAIRRELEKLPKTTVVIHGDSPGADALAGQIAAEMGLAVEATKKTKADYQKYGKGAWKGLNERMLASGVSLVLAFHPAIDKSRGTKHLVEIAKEASIETLIFTD